MQGFLLAGEENYLHGQYLKKIKFKKEKSIRLSNLLSIAVKVVVNILNHMKNNKL